MSRREPTGGPPPRAKPVEVPVDYGHKHRQPSTALRALTVAVVGLVVVAGLLGWYAFVVEARAIDAEQQASQTDQRLKRLEEDLTERTRQRDAERDTAAALNKQTRAEVMTVLCEVLAELPADAPNLNRIREALDCAQPGASTPPASGPAEPQPAPAPPGPAPTPSPLPPNPGAPGSPPPRDEPPAAPPSPSEPTPGLLCGLLPIAC